MARDGSLWDTQIACSPSRNQPKPYESMKPVVVKLSEVGSWSKFSSGPVGCCWSIGSSECNRARRSKRSREATFFR